MRSLIDFHDLQLKNYRQHNLTPCWFHLCYRWHSVYICWVGCHIAHWNHCSTFKMYIISDFLHEHHLMHRLLMNCNHNTATKKAPDLAWCRLSAGREWSMVCVSRVNRKHQNLPSTICLAALSWTCCTLKRMWYRVTWYCISYHTCSQNPCWFPLITPLSIRYSITACHTILPRSLHETDVRLTGL